MKCRINIKGRKIWVDNDNSYLTRPTFTEIVLRRDGEVYKTAIIDSFSGGVYRFPCLVKWKNSTEQYLYEVDEVAVPEGYTKSFQGYNIINTLTNITIEGTKIWDDNDDQDGYRPEDVTIRLLQNNVEIDSMQVPSPLAGNTVNFTFGQRPFADAQGVPYSYTIAEDTVENYKTSIEGFVVTNTLNIIIPFSFIKTSARTGMSLQGASFEIRKNGIVQSTATSDENGLVSFTFQSLGAFSLQESQPPAGNMSDVTVYDVFVAGNGDVTVNDAPASEFSIVNQPALVLQRATATVSSYMAAPNTWPLNGTGEIDLYMADRILMTTPLFPLVVKWDFGIRTVSYFSSGGGHDITSSYTSGIPVSLNGDYSVYVLLNNGQETVETISIDRIRDGSLTMPYLLLDFATASNLEPTVTGTGQFSLEYMQGGGIKQTLNYEIYEDIEMIERVWVPLGGPTSESFTGSLNGNGNNIKNLVVLPDTDYYGGLFFRVENGTVENLNLIGSIVENDISQSGGFAGAVIANNGNVTIMRNLRYTGSVNANGAGAITGITSAANGTLIIENCSSDADITGINGAGLVGSININASPGNITIRNCIAEGSVNCENSAAGIIGIAIASYGQVKVENCVNNAMVHGISGSAGGILANGAFVSGEISSCYNGGEITGGSSVGGIAGSCSSGLDTFVIRNCYNSAKITINGVNSVSGGGIAGHSSSKIENSYNVNDIDVVAAGTISNAAGGIAGNYGIIENSAAINAICSIPQGFNSRISQSIFTQTQLNNNMAFENMQVLINGIQKTPLDIGISGTDGLSTTALALKTQSLYDSMGWDFNDTWIFGNNDYTLPILRAIPIELQPAVLPSHLQ